MANITRSVPTKASRLDPFDDPFEDLFRGFFLRPMTLGSSPSSGQHEQFRIDVDENDKELRVQAELPGVRKEDINVTIEGNQVAMSAETRNEKDVKGERGNVVHSERYYGKLYRSFSLEHEIDQAKAQAKYHDGVLELILPKASADTAKKKRLEVH